VLDEKFFRLKEILTTFCKYDVVTREEWNYLKQHAEILLWSMTQAEKVNELENDVPFIEIAFTSLKKENNPKDIVVKVKKNRYRKVNEE